MYDLPEVRGATDAWWSGLARHLSAAGLAEVPPNLSRPDDLGAHWNDPAMLFSQSCGYPLTHALEGKVRIVATPCYDAPGCAGADYRSLVIVAADSPASAAADLSGARCAVSSFTSHSGFNSLRALVAPLTRGTPFFAEAVVSGGHGLSIAMVGRGEVDAAAVDCVTHALLAAHAPGALAGTRVLCRTPAAPGLPYVTAAATTADDLARLRNSVRAALADPGLAETRATLRIAGAEVLPADAYGRILDMERQAMEAGAAALA